MQTCHGHMRLCMRAWSIRAVVMRLGLILHYWQPPPLGLEVISL